MAEELFIPMLGQTVEEVTLINWLVKDGDQVEQGQEVLEVETDKAVFNVEAIDNGFIHIGPFKVGDVVPVLSVVAVIGDKNEKFKVKTTKKDKSESIPEKAEESNTTQEVLSSKEVEPVKSEKVFISPRARKLAAQKNISLDLVTPTGGNGIRITEADVKQYLKMASETGKEPEKFPDMKVKESFPLKGVRSVIAERMSQSAHTTASVTLFLDADATELVAYRENLKTQVEKEWGFVPGYNDLLVRICARALKEFPYMNARLNGDVIENLEEINIGIAVDAEKGLFVPVIRDADTKDLRAIGIEFRQRVDEIHEGKISPDDLTGGTFTITNLGMYDIEGFTPVINYPEAAILGVGRIIPKAVVIENEIVIRKMLTLSLVFDHRLIDGAPAARFLQLVKSQIETPNY